jgi:hypothetical protein
MTDHILDRTTQDVINIKIAAQGKCDICELNANCKKCHAVVRMIKNKNITHHCISNVGNTSKICGKFLKGPDLYCGKHINTHKRTENFTKKCRGCPQVLSLSDNALHCDNCRNEKTLKKLKVDTQTKNKTIDTIVCNDTIEQQPKSLISITNSDIFDNFDNIETFFDNVKQNNKHINDLDGDGSSDVQEASLDNEPTIKLVLCGYPIKDSDGTHPCNNAVGLNKYCGKHIKHLNIDENIKNGIRNCKKCLEQLPENYDVNKKKCESCLVKLRKTENLRRATKAKTIETLNQNGDIYVCISCPTEYITIEVFRDVRGNISKKCESCREKERERDRKRDRSNRDYGDYETRPEVIERKKKWREDNYDKCAKYWIEARSRRIKNEGIELYLKNNAAAAKKWRDSNWSEDDRIKINHNKKVSIPDKIQTYKRDAMQKNREFTLTDNECKDMFLNDCYYCGSKVDISIELNGIDRLNNDLFYTTENTVSSCKMCNMIKGEHNVDNFLKIIEHILTKCDFISGKLYPECFKNYTSANYNKYKENSLKRNKCFELSEHEFYSLVSDFCYLCGKINTSLHSNGIDRIDNEVGYSITNCVTCCGTCNYMKNNYEFNIFIDKLVEIYNNHHTLNIKTEQLKAINISLINIKDIDIIENQREIVKKNNNAIHLKTYEDKRRKEYGDVQYKAICALEKSIKRDKRQNIDSSQKIQKLNELKEKKITILKSNPTPKEKKQQNAVRQQQHRDKMKNQYGDETFKKIRSLEIAIQRAKKINSTEKVLEYETELNVLKKITTDTKTSQKIKII